jgi:predicted phosphodiesterase|nr:MAG TPA: metallophosphatase domain protein [Caudoviricetes sp.]
MQKVRIDFDNPGLPQHISAVENDSQSRFFQATLYENGKAYTAPEGAAYSIMYRGFGPQNQGWYDTINDGAGKRAACAVSGNVVTCEIARQALQVPGHVSIVLCVTTGKGYMLKSWPIECDCKNDRYDSTVEIESFFYITQVSNADWTQVIQAWENLKDAIDPTLSISGKAADAKATGDAIGELKEDIGDLSNALKIVVPIVRNGSLGNPGNTDAVCMKYSMSWGKIKRAVVTMVSSPKGCTKYQWVYRTYSEGNVETQSESKIIELDPYLFTTENHVIIENWADKAFGVGVLCYDSQDVPIPLRINSVGSDCFKIELVGEEPTALVPSVLNGSLGNPNNEFYVRVGEVIPIPKDFAYIQFDFDDYGLGLDFIFDLWTYNETGVPGTKYSSRIQEISDLSKNYVSKSQISAEAKSYCITVTATRNGERYALRSENIFDFIRIKYILYPEQEIAKVNTRISATEKDIGDLSNALETDITQIKKKLAQSRFGDCVSLLHFSDIHADRSALKKISEAIDNYDSNIDGSICTGDIVANSYGSISSWWNNKIMTCIGNHDSASYSSGTYDWTYLPMSERSALYIEPFEAFWGVNHEQGTSYYYKDFTNKKVRLIVIDTMLYMSDSTSSEASAQTVWLQTLLNTAKENGYHVIIATHAPNGLAKSMECSFSKYHTSERVMPIEKDCTLPNSIVDTVKTAIDGGLHFVGYICGHTHQDDIWVCAGDSRQLMYCIATSNVENINQWKNTDLWHGENCNAYNLVTIDTSTKTVCIIRGGGANADKFMRERKLICIDYAHAKLIN